MRTSLLAICLLIALSSSSLAFWEPLGTGTDGPVYALAVYDGDLIAGGEFMNAGGNAVNHIARWDGVSWQPLGPGLDGSGVFALAIYGGDLIAGGWFHSAGGVEVNHIARWDGTAWTPLETGVGAYDGDYVQALAVYNGRLIAGGPFTQAGGQPARYVAQWDGTSWSPLGAGMDNRVCALAAYAGDLMAGGFFLEAGGQPASYLAQWDGSSWSAVGSGMNNYVTALGLYGGDLVAGGYFTQAGSVPAARVASWDGNTWSPFGSGTDNAVNALASYDGGLIAGGFFSHAGGIAASRIARWDGFSWSPLGAGVNGSNGVASLLDLGGLLIAGGYFSEAGGEPANDIAQWSSEPTPVLLESCQVSSLPEGLNLRWELPIGTTGVLGRVWRDAFAGPGDAVPTPDAELVSDAWVAPSADGIIEILDAVPPLGAAVRYFLELSANDAGHEFLGPVEARWDPPAMLWEVGPNPFRSAVRMVFPGTGLARAEIFDPAGRLVRALAGEGRAVLAWDGRNASGDEAPSGVYVVRLTSMSGSAVTRLVKIQ